MFLRVSSNPDDPPDHYLGVRLGYRKAKAKSFARPRLLLVGSTSWKEPGHVHGLMDCWEYNHDHSPFDGECRLYTMRGVAGVCRQAIKYAEKRKDYWAVTTVPIQKKKYGRLAPFVANQALIDFMPDRVYVLHEALWNGVVTQDLIYRAVRERIPVTLFGCDPIDPSWFPEGSHMWEFWKERERHEYPVPSNAKCRQCGRSPEEGEVMGHLPGPYWDSVKMVCPQCWPPRRRRLRKYHLKMPHEPVKEGLVKVKEHIELDESDLIKAIGLYLENEGYAFEADSNDVSLRVDGSTLECLFNEEEVEVSMNGQDIKILIHPSEADEEDEDEEDEDEEDEDDDCEEGG